MVIVTLATAFVFALPSCLAGSRQASSYPWETHVQDNTFGAVDLPLGDAEYNPFAYGQANIDRGMYGSSLQQHQGGYEMHPDTFHGGASSAEWYPSQMQTPWDGSNHYQQSEHNSHLTQPYFGHDQEIAHTSLEEYEPSSYQGFEDPYGRANPMSHAAHEMERMSIAGGFMAPTQMGNGGAGESSQQSRGANGKERAEDGSEDNNDIPSSVRAPATRAPRDLVKAKMAKDVMNKEWHLRKLSCRSFQAPELAAQVAEIKIAYPEYARSIGQLALQLVRENADPRNGRAYEQQYQAWTYTYSNRIKNLKITYAGFSPEDLRVALLAEFRNVDIIQGPPIPSADNEEKQLSIMTSVWYDFQSRFLDKALASGAQLSGHLIATLSQRYHYTRQTADESMEYLAHYMSQVLSFPPDEIAQFYLVRAQLAHPKTKISRARRPRASN